MLEQDKTQSTALYSTQVSFSQHLQHFATVLSAA